ncbi:MAG TPA: hypothetical protein VM219_08885 [Phycisphaerae bacterium]|nr:hypothetical protein [Phycisphaerae bacterium]HUX03018.1 hypothetical protein [Phycisphaerae bacterium]
MPRASDEAIARGAELARLEKVAMHYLNRAKLAMLRLRTREAQAQARLAVTAIDELEAFLKAAEERGERRIRLAPDLDAAWRGMPDDDDGGGP